MTSFSSTVEVTLPAAAASGSLTLEVFDAEDNKMDWSEWQYIAQELDAEYKKGLNLKLEG